MKCPKCGSEMQADNHRKIPMKMCYKCGYIEGRVQGDKHITNFEQMKSLKPKQLAVFLASGTGVDAAAIENWLNSAFER